MTVPCTAVHMMHMLVKLTPNYATNALDPGVKFLEGMVLEARSIS